MGHDLRLSCASAYMMIQVQPDPGGSTPEPSHLFLGIQPCSCCYPAFQKRALKAKNHLSLKQHELFLIHQHFPEPLLESPGEFFHLSSTGVIPPC